MAGTVYDIMNFKDMVLQLETATDEFTTLPNLKSVTIPDDPWEWFPITGGGTNSDDEKRSGRGMEEHFIDAVCEIDIQKSDGTGPTYVAAQVDVDAATLGVEPRRGRFYPWGYNADYGYYQIDGIWKRIIAPGGGTRDDNNPMTMRLEGRVHPYATEASGWNNLPAAT